MRRQKLDDRHRIVHSVASREQTEDGRIRRSFWNPKSDKDELIDASQIRVYARDVRQLGRQAFHVAHSAAEWHTASARPEATT